MKCTWKKGRIRRQSHDSITRMYTHRVPRQERLPPPVRARADRAALPPRRLPPRHLGAELHKGQPSRCRNTNLSFISNFIHLSPRKTICNKQRRAKLGSNLDWLESTATACELRHPALGEHGQEECRHLTRDGGKGLALLMPSGPETEPLKYFKAAMGLGHLSTYGCDWMGGCVRGWMNVCMMQMHDPASFSWTLCPRCPSSPPCSPPCSAPCRPVRRPRNERAEQCTAYIHARIRRSHSIV